MDEFTLATAQRYAGEPYAVELTGVVLEEARVGYTRCRLDIDRKHMNGLGRVMGGAIFTLADFAFGVAANCGDQPPTVTLSGSIEFLSAPENVRCLYAETECLRSGRGTCVMDVKITDGSGSLVAKATMTGYRLAR